MIVFKKLTFQNILSVGNTPVTIDLNSHKTTLIHGTNGTGKSTVLDALTYSLFGKPFRKINLPQLLNSQNKKGLVTEIEFSIGSNDFVVRRGMKPKLFEVFKNGEQLDNKAADKDTQSFLEQAILKLSYKSFTQIRKALTAALGEGPATVPELAARTGLAGADVMWHVIAMKKYGLVVEGAPQGDYYTYSLAGKE